MVCPKCSNGGWVGSYGFKDVDSRYCDCEHGKNLQDKMNGRQSILPITQLGVEGRRLLTSLSHFERTCMARIREALDLGYPDTALVATLSDAVRLAREYADNKPQIFCQCEIYQTCAVCRDSKPKSEEQLVLPLSQDTSWVNDPHERMW